MSGSGTMYEHYYLNGTLGLWNIPGLNIFMLTHSGHTILLTVYRLAISF